MNRLLAVFAVVLFATVAWATYPPVKQAVVPAVIAPVVQVPTYSASYQPDGGALELLKEILAEVKALRAEVAELRGKKAQAEPKAAEPLALVRARCTGCHNAGEAEKKGGGFVLLTADGNLPPLSLVEKKRITRRLERGQMPPPPAKLDETEKKALTEFFKE